MYKIYMNENSINGKRSRCVFFMEVITRETVKAILEKFCDNDLDVNIYEQTSKNVTEEFIKEKE